MTYHIFYTNNLDLTRQFNRKKAQIINSEELAFKTKLKTFIKKKSVSFNKN